LASPPPPLGDHTNSAEAFHEARKAHLEGQLEAAADGYRQAIALDPSNADAIHLLGVVHAQQQHFQQAESLMHQAISIKEIWAYYDSLGKTLRQQGKLAPARSAFLRAAELKPDHADALNAAGFISLELGELDQAEAYFRRLLAQQPNLPVIHNNLGNVLFQLQRHVEAEAAYRHSITLAPNYAQAHYNLGILLSATLRTDEAIAAYQETIRCQPDHYEAYNNLGNLLLDQKRYADAEHAYREALAVHPGLVEVVTNLGNLYAEQKRFVEAETQFRAALSLDPDRLHERVLLSYCKRQMYSWQGIDVLHAEIADALAHRPGIVLEPLQLFSIAEISPLDQRRMGHNKIVKDFGNILCHPSLAAPASARASKRLRIGYLSADFHEHATMHLLLGVLEHRNTMDFETYLYSFGPPVEDGCRQRTRHACEHFQDIRSLSDRAAAELIAVDGIDILVDLKGYTTDSRLGISAWHPAPVLVSWLGYPGSLGHPRLADYIIGDPTVTPLEHAAHFSETLALLPYSYQPNDNSRPLGTKPARATVGLPEQGFVFCSFNQANKLNPETFTVWSQLLQAVPDSVLWLLDAPPVAIVNLRAEAARHGIAAARLIFAPWAQPRDHLGRLQLADLALDTFPYGSHTTGSDALWAGVPLIARMGDTFASRVSASLLNALGFPELVARNWDDYYTLALRLARNPTELSALRARLQQHRYTSPLFDTPRFSRDLERLYQAIWQQQFSGRRAPIALPPSP
jgi:predicted O-linked N-acetylglucosamine transferase (SPINDLY family)